MAVFGPRGEGHAHKEYTPKDIQDLQRWADKINEVIVVIEANIVVMSALRQYYVDLLDNKDFPAVLKRFCSDDVFAFAA
jgi:hypothetical protein